jgi:hypothetical protein
VARWLIYPVMLGVLTASPAGAQARLPSLCGNAYPSATRFIVEDGGQDDHGNLLKLCTEYLRQGGQPILGLPISRPFRVSGELYQAFEFGVLHWRSDLATTEQANVLDIMHRAGRDAALQRLGVPPDQGPDVNWLTDAGLRDAYVTSVHPKYGLPTSAPVIVGPYIAQRFQHGLLRRWLSPPPFELAGRLVRLGNGPPTVERVMVGDIFRSVGLIPAAALVANSGSDVERYKWLTVPDVPDTFWAPDSSAVGAWFALDRRAGAFDIGSETTDEPSALDEVQQASDLGLTLAINGYVGRDDPVVKSSLDHHLDVIDTYPWNRIAAECGSALADQSCSLDDQQLVDLTMSIQHHLDISRQDDSVAGYWILDDFPGDVHTALEVVHGLVQQENLRDRMARPTICGFGGSLDDAQQAPAQTRAAFDQSLTNYTSAGCDAVALYPYAGANHPDWTMHDLLPHMLDGLRARGWEPLNQPLIGIPQAFRPDASLRPSASDLATQTTAYCAAGATTIAFYAWNDNSGARNAELGVAPDIRSGASDGLAQCATYWANQTY